MHPESGPDGPRGTVTFLFTDIEGSTRLLQEIGGAYPVVLADQKALLLQAAEAHGGHLVDSAGDGLFFAFSRASDALAGTVAAQRALAAHPWPEGVAVRVRMGVHTGEPVVAGTDYVGLDVHRAARISDAAHGGQILVSEVTRQLVGDELPAGVTLIDLGEHRLKDLVRPERLYQVRANGLSDSFPPLRAAGRISRSNLPARATRLIGRDEDLDSIQALLLRDDVRLLSLTGTGGTGKTSLAVEVATRCEARFADGAVFVPLAPVHEPALATDAIAQALGVEARARQEIGEAIADHLRDRRLLLVLDNFEHILDAAPLVAALVNACPHITVLVTSRFALRLSMEREFPVPPLRMPDRSASLATARLQAYPAVELFVQRAVAVKPGFGLDDDGAVAVAEICNRLDGLPLAIELAAARIKLFSPRALLARLDRRLELLSGGARDLPDRHRTLRHAIGWSYDLLEPGEQAVFRRLAVFAGGCTVESAEAVCAAAGGPALPAIDGIAALIDKSLLRQDPGEEDEPRFVMLETVREFALEKLEEANEAQVTRQAHADFLIALAGAAAPELRAEKQHIWLPRLERERDDFAAAFAWIVETGDTHRALRLAAALCRFWIIRGLHKEGRRHLRAVLGLPRDHDDAPLRARVLSGSAILAYEQADLVEATSQLQATLDHFRTVGDAKGIAETLNHLGWVSLYSGDVEQSRALSEEALAIHERRGDNHGIARSLTNLGGLSLQLGELERSRDLYERALELRRLENDARSVAYGKLNVCWALIRLGEVARATALATEAERALRSLGDNQILAFACYLLGEAKLEAGNPAEALPHLEESVILSREITQTTTLGVTLSSVAEALGRTGQLDRAIELAREAVTLFDQNRTYIWQCICLTVLGDVLRMAGRTGEARDVFFRMVDFALDLRMHPYVADALARLAVLEAEASHPEAALRLIGASRSERAVTGTRASSRGPDLDALETDATAVVGPDHAAALLREGASHPIADWKDLIR